MQLMHTINWINLFYDEYVYNFYIKIQFDIFGEQKMAKKCQGDTAVLIS